MIFRNLILDTSAQRSTSLQVGIVIKRVVDLGELAGSFTVSRSKNFKGISAYRPETIQRTDGQGPVQARVTSNLYMIILRAVYPSNP
jgi:hypothetical protein